MAHTSCMLHKQGYMHAFARARTHTSIFFFHGNNASRTRLNVTLYVHCLSCFYILQYHNNTTEGTSLTYVHLLYQPNARYKIHINIKDTTPTCFSRYTILWEYNVPRSKPISYVEIIFTKFHYVQHDLLSMISNAYGRYTCAVLNLTIKMQL